jgi:hypothetical protein
MTILPTSTAPELPTDLNRDDANTNTTQVAFSWTPPAENGGPPIIGYEIYWKQGTGNWTIYEALHTGTSLIVL